MAKFSISTKKGDKGNTSVMHGREVPKHNLRVDAYGTIDELNAALGVVRAAISDVSFQEELLSIQKQTFVINSELATTLYDDFKPVKEKIGEEHLSFLQSRVDSIEANYDVLKEWAIPGGNWHSALLDLARTICRRAERAVVVLDQNQLLTNKLIIQYLNRLSDLLWLFARREEIKKKSGKR